jgi:hypothetical protein
MPTTQVQTLGFAKTFGKFWSTCGRPHVRPCVGGAHLWDHALVGPHVGVACGTRSLFFFKLFCDDNVVVL